MPAAMLLLASNLSIAQDDAELHPFLEKRFFVSLGIYFPDRSFKFEVDGTRTVTFENEPIDFSEQFRLDGYDESGAIEIGWRYSQNWMLRGQYFRVNDSNLVFLDKDVAWGDTVFNAGSNAGAGAEVEVTRIFFGRTYRQTENQEIGFGAGLHWLEIGAFIAGNASKNGVNVGFRNEAVDVEGPLPNIGAWYMYSFSSRWAANIRYDWLSANVDKYEGRMVNAATGLTYGISDHFAAGLSYNYFELDLAVNDIDWRGSTKIRFHGFYTYFAGYW